MIPRRQHPSTLRGLSSPGSLSCTIQVAGRGSGLRTGCRYAALFSRFMYGLSDQRCLSQLARNLISVCDGLSGLPSTSEEMSVFDAKTLKWDPAVHPWFPFITSPDVTSS